MYMHIIKGALSIFEPGARSFFLHMGVMEDRCIMSFSCMVSRLAFLNMELLVMCVMNQSMEIILAIGNTSNSTGGRLITCLTKPLIARHRRGRSGENQRTRWQNKLATSSEASETRRWIGMLAARHAVVALNIGTASR
jgi:hypothetical protein